MAMTMWTVLLALTGLAWVGVLAQKPELEILPAGIRNQGDNLTITCRIPGMGRLDIMRIVKDVGGKPYEIMTNNVVAATFRNPHGKYKMAEYNHDERSVTLTITGITGVDAGNIGCMKLPNGEAAYEDVVINVPPKHIEIMYLTLEGGLEPAVEGTKVQLTEGEEAGITCLVTVDGLAENREPMVNILLDDTDDITGIFTKTPEWDIDNENGLVHRNYEAQYKWRTNQPDLSYNRKTLTCRASTPEFPPISTYVELEVQYGPKLDCETKLMAKLGTKDYSVVCVGTMHPEPLSSIWTIGKKGNRTIVQQDETIGSYTASVKNVGGDSYEFSLVVTNVTEDMFQKYKLEASNGLGSAETTLKLTEAPEEPTPPYDVDSGNPGSAVGAQAPITSNFVLFSLMTIVAAMLFGRS